MADDYLPIRVEVPVCAFRPFASREYQDTYPAPPPATVYGMLLSLLGIPREQRSLHRGCEMALAIPDAPESTARSRVFRKLRRGKDLESTRPDYQDLLLDLKLWVWLRSGEDAAIPSLAERIPAAIHDPTTIKKRFGGLSLGESSYLVDVVAIDREPPESLVFLMPDEQGFYSFPIWVDHLDRKNTVARRFSLSSPLHVTDGLSRAWFSIG